MLSTFWDEWTTLTPDFKEKNTKYNEVMYSTNVSSDDKWKIFKEKTLY